MTLFYLIRVITFSDGELLKWGQKGKPIEEELEPIIEQWQVELQEKETASYVEEKADERENTEEGSGNLMQDLLNELHNNENATEEESKVELTNNIEQVTNTSVDEKENVKLSTENDTLQNPVEKDNTDCDTKEQIPTTIANEEVDELEAMKSMGLPTTFQAEKSLDGAGVS